MGQGYKMLIIIIPVVDGSNQFSKKNLVLEDKNIVLATTYNPNFIVIYIRLENAIIKVNQVFNESVFKLC